MDIVITKGSKANVWIIVLALWCVILVDSLERITLQTRLLSRFSRPYTNRNRLSSIEGSSLNKIETLDNKDIVTSLPYDATELQEFNGDPDLNPVLESIPPRVQRYIRDSGILRNVVDVLTRVVMAPEFYYKSPHCFPEFIRISEYPHWLSLATRHVMRSIWNVTDPYASCDAHNLVEGDATFTNKSRITFQKEKYGSHRRQSADVMIKEDLLDNKQVPLLIFFHGGAWGSGFPTMYRLISTPFLEKNYRAVVLGYRTYPDGTMEDQMQDLEDAVKYFTEKYASTPIDSPGVVVIGHSSGAQIAMMAALKGRFFNRVDALIGMSGAYDLELVRARESRNGLVGISPLDPTSGKRLREYSPSWLAARTGTVPGYLNASEGEAVMCSLPPILLLHGQDDTVTLPIQSKVFYRVLNDNERKRSGKELPKNRCHLEIIKGAEHQDTVLETSLGRGRTQSAIFEWLNNI